MGGMPAPALFNGQGSCTPFQGFCTVPQMLLRKEGASTGRAGCTHLLINVPSKVPDKHVKRLALPRGCSMRACAPTLLGPLELKGPAPGNLHAGSQKRSRRVGCS